MTDTCSIMVDWRNDPKLLKTIDIYKMEQLLAERIVSMMRV